MFICQHMFGLKPWINRFHGKKAVNQQSCANLSKGNSFAKRAEYVSPCMGRQNQPFPLD